MIYNTRKLYDNNMYNNIYSYNDTFKLRQIENTRMSS